MGSTTPRTICSHEGSFEATSDATTTAARKMAPATKHLPPNHPERRQALPQPDGDERRGETQDPRPGFPRQVAAHECWVSSSFAMPGPNVTSVTFSTPAVRQHQIRDGGALRVRDDDGLVAAAGQPAQVAPHASQRMAARWMSLWSRTKLSPMVLASARWIAAAAARTGAQGTSASSRTSAKAASRSGIRSSAASRRQEMPRRLERADPVASGAAGRGSGTRWSRARRRGTSAGGRREVGRQDRLGPPGFGEEEGPRIGIVGRAVERHDRVRRFGGTVRGEDGVADGDGGSRAAARRVVRSSDRSTS